MHPIFKISSRLSPLFRGERMAHFLQVFQPDKTTKILDIGGTPKFWAGVPVQAHITLLNLYPLDDYDSSFMTPNQTSVIGDGTRLDYADAEFDIVFSNSVIEHLGSWERQCAFAGEAQRVGKAYWVQTPAKEFFLEAHYLTPFIHWLPSTLQRRLLRNFTLWGWLGRPDQATVDRVWAELKLLRRRQILQLFPSGALWVERFLGMPKSYTAYKLPATSPARDASAAQLQPAMLAHTARPN